MGPLGLCATRGTDVEPAGAVTGPRVQVPIAPAVEFEKVLIWRGDGTPCAPLRAFLQSSGWAPDGAHQSVGSENDSAHVKMLRYHTTLS